MTKHRIQAYYSVPFEASTGVPMSVRELKRPQHRKTGTLEKAEADAILRDLRRPLCPGVFEEPFLRLIVVVDGRDEFLVDSEGRVRHGAANYYITPGSLLRLRSFVLGMPWDR